MIRSMVSVCMSGSMVEPIWVTGLLESRTTNAFISYQMDRFGGVSMMGTQGRSGYL
jgi:hypothetical protein